MVERTLVRQDVHEPQVDPVDRHRPRHCLEGIQATDLPEAAARLPRLFEQRQRQAAGRAQVPPPLLRHPLEKGGLREHRNASDLEELLQIAERDGRVEIGTVDRRTDAGERDLESGTMLRSQISGLRHRRDRHRREVRHELGILRPHRLHHDRIGRADQGTPWLVFPELKIFGCNEFVADYTAGHGPEPGSVAGIDELFGSGRVKMGDRFRTQNQDTFALRDNREGPPDLAIYLDRPMGTGRHALPAPDTRLIDHLEEQWLIARHRDSVGGADPYACQACDTELSVDDEIQCGRATMMEG